MLREVLLDSFCCRLCGSVDGEAFLDLGAVPLANSLLTAAEVNRTEQRYPVKLWACRKCWLVQLESAAPPERIFSEYVYFSSISSSWREHCERYATGVITRLGLTPRSQVVEIGSNDGCLVRTLLGHGIPALGIEPAANVARVAEANGAPTEVAFFDRNTAARLRDRFRADLIVANNVLAHAPDINSFVEGLAVLLKPQGTVTIEVPYLLRMIEQCQFDTIYSEHVFYLSLLSLETALARHDLTAYHVEFLATHGGSIRVYAAHRMDARTPSAAILNARAAERAANLDSMERYRRFSDAVTAVKQKIGRFFEDAASHGKRVVGYSAAAKGISLLNYADIESRYLDYVVDRSPHKQGLYLPGTHLPIYAPERVTETRPDYLLILAWNLREEVMEQMSAIREWKGQFVIPIPEPTFVP